LIIVTVGCSEECEEQPLSMVGFSKQNEEHLLLADFSKQQPLIVTADFSGQQKLKTH
jgi:hypothetical protein